MEKIGHRNLGDAAAALPHWPDLEADSNQLPPGIDIDDLQAFVTLYRDHCEVYKQHDDIVLDTPADNRLTFCFATGHARRCH